jgi:hypothetical protein
MGIAHEIDYPKVNGAVGKRVKVSRVFVIEILKVLYNTIIDTERKTALLVEIQALFQVEAMIEIQSS